MILFLSAFLYKKLNVPIQNFVFSLSSSYALDGDLTERMGSPRGAGPENLNVFNATIDRVETNQQTEYILELVDLISCRLYTKRLIDLPWDVLAPHSTISYGLSFLSRANSLYMYSALHQNTRYINVDKFFFSYTTWRCAIPQFRL
uniref:AlNc14C142G7290 protein n=1 Tax=Albugo laibachii Nc14 TaxID=890382 RepID=F0WLA2_9STRA|nr:AlNc14C142G7290 [Albugo laibachii Nc14]|eukprot:CCA22064.1 AlNc14C142G7290 [Albugo laibachii Nc14]